MKKLTKILLIALLAIPFLQSCNAKVEQADKAALVTVQKSLDPAGFYGILDNGERLYPGVMRVSYTPSKDIQRAIVYFSELDEPREGYKYNADVFNVAEVTTQHVTPVTTPAADTASRLQMPGLAAASLTWSSRLMWRCTIPETLPLHCRI